MGCRPEGRSRQPISFFVVFFAPHPTISYEEPPNYATEGFYGISLQSHGVVHESQYVRSIYFFIGIDRRNLRAAKISQRISVLTEDGKADRKSRFMAAQTHDRAAHVLTLESTPGRRFLFAATIKYPIGKGGTDKLGAWLAAHIADMCRHNAHRDTLLVQARPITGGDRWRHRL